MILSRAILPAGLLGFSAALEGNTAVIGVPHAGIAIVDLTDSAALKLVTIVPLCERPQGIAFADGHVAVADDFTGLHVARLNDRQGTRLGSFDTGYEVAGLAAFDRWCLVASGAAGLAVVDARIPAQIRLAATVDTPGSALAVAARAGIAYVADFDAGLGVFDMADPEHPMRLRQLQTPGKALDVVLASSVVLPSSVALVADHVAGLQIVDISNPAAPFIAANVPTVGRALRVAGSGTRAFVHDSDVGVLVVDIADPSSPRALGSIAATQVYDLAGNDRTLAIASGAGGVRLYDVGGVAPVALATWSTPGATQQLFLAGSLLYVSDGFYAGFTVIDVSDPRSPRLVGRSWDGGTASDIEVAADVAYTARSTGRIEVVAAHCEKPTPVFLTDLHLEVDSDAIHVQWRITGTEVERVEVQRAIGSAAGPFEVRAVLVPERELVRSGTTMEFIDYDIEPGVTYIYQVVATSRDGGVAMLGPLTSTAARGRLALELTTPARERVQIRFSLAQTGPVRLDVYDAAGRHVRALPVAASRPGHHAVVWDASGRSEDRVPNGIYFVRLEQQGHTVTRRLTLVR